MSRIISARYAFILAGLCLVLGIVAVWANQGIMKQVELPRRIVPSLSGVYGQGNYGTITWVDDLLITDYENRPIQLSTVYSTKLWQLHPDGTDMHEMELPPYPGCRENGYAAPTRLPDGRLGYAVLCNAGDGLKPSLYIAAYDIKTKQATPLLKSPLHTFNVGGGGFSWDPSMTRALITDGKGYFDVERLMIVTTDTAQYMDVPGPVSYAGTWSPDGKRIAFIGGGKGFSSPFNLYIMNSNGTDMHTIETNLHGVTNLAWSLDGRFIIHNNTIEHLLSKEFKLYAVEVATGKVKSISTGLYFSPSWSPDGKSLVVRESIGEAFNSNNLPTDRIVILDMTSLWSLFDKD